MAELCISTFYYHSYDISFDNKYHMRLKNKSSNNHHGADVFVTEAYKKNPWTLQGYIKNNVLHFSIISVHFNGIGVRVYPTSKNVASMALKGITSFCKRLSVDSETPHFTHLKMKIDWTDLFSNSYWSKSLFRKTLNTDLNKRFYRDALIKFNLGKAKKINNYLHKSNYLILKKAKKNITKSLIHKDDLSNSSISNDLIKANMYIKSALYKKRHLSFVKQQKDNKTKQIAR